MAKSLINPIDKKFPASAPCLVSSFTPMYKQRYLSEFSTEEEKEQARINLGIKDPILSWLDLKGEVLENPSVTNYINSRIPTIDLLKVDDIVTAPRDADGNVDSRLMNPNDTLLRFMVATNKVFETTSSGLLIEFFPWGPGWQSYDWLLELSFSYLDSNNNYKNFSNEWRNSEIYDVSSISSTGYGNIRWLSYRDTTSELGILNYGFALGGVTSTSDIPSHNDYGSAFLETDSLLKLRILDDDLANLAGETYKSGDIVNRGYISTLRIIQTRNSILQTGVNFPEGGVFIPPLLIPNSTNTKTELECLVSDLESLHDYFLNLGYTDQKSWSYTDIYFPAASAAYAYEPLIKSNEFLHKKFKKHNWFLPPLFFLGMLRYYTLKDFSLFEKAINNKIYTPPSSKYSKTLKGYLNPYIASSEESGQNGIDAYMIDSTNTGSRVLTDVSKFYCRVVFPFCAF